MHNLSGQIFGRLTAIKPVKIGKDRKWECLCECGNTHTVLTTLLIDGRSRSCGCLGSENLIRQRYKHGKSYSNIYRKWAGMMTRCYHEKSKSYKNYGARGILVHPAWHDFAAFYEAVGDPPFDGATLERKNNNLGYMPGNVVWATAKEQVRNRRVSKSVTFKDKEYPLQEASDVFGVPYATLWARLFKLKWTAAEALTTPVSPANKRYKFLSQA